MSERRLVECTGVSATWCPIHGNCTCPHLGDDPFNGRDFEVGWLGGCPLHGMDSTHGEDPTAVAELERGRWPAASL